MMEIEWHSAKHPDQIIEEKDAEIERLKIERENTCMMCNMLEREVCAEQKVHLRAEIERLREALKMLLDYIDTSDMRPLDLRIARAALAEKEVKP